MRNLFRGSALLVVGMLLGSLLTVGNASQQPRDAGVRLNGVGLSVRDFDAAVSYYTKTFELRETFIRRDQEGRPIMGFLQISRETFLQLVPANPNRRPGLSSVLIEVDDIQSTVAKLRQAGAQLQDPRVSQNTGTTLTMLTDPEGFRVELLQMTPGSLIRTAMESWK